MWYRAFDLVPRHPQVRKCDITSDILPYSDAILSRMVFNHLGQAKTDEAIALFRESGAKYLITNRYEFKTRDFHRISLWEPLEEAPDGHEDGCFIGIYEL